MKKFNLIFISILFLATQGMAQEWLVPEDQKAVKNPSEYNLTNVKKGKDLYNLNCKSCHGDAGKNNALPLVPPPPDVISDIMHANTEGELFYKITKGRGGMPQFETTISEDDRWRLVNYISNYNPANEPVMVEAPPVKAKLQASINTAENKVEISAEFENKSGKYEKLAETAVSISAKRTFGNLPIGEALTNNEGQAEFEIPANLIGDEEGKISIVVSLGDGFVTEALVLEPAKIGTQKQHQQLIKKGVLWSTNDNMPLWLILSYLGAVGLAWLTIAYVAFQIVKIIRLNKE